MASRDLRSLERRLDRVAARLSGAVERLVGEIIEEIGRELVPATPVDTGFARANWRPSINAPATSPLSFLDPSGAATIGQIVTVGKRWRIGDTAYITNQAPYIGELNQGSSPQAPAGFVGESVDRGVARAIDRIRQAGVL